MNDGPWRSISFSQYGIGQPGEASIGVGLVMRRARPPAVRPRRRALLARPCGDDELKTEE